MNELIQTAMKKQTYLGYQSAADVEEAQSTDLGNRVINFADQLVQQTAL